MSATITTTTPTPTPTLATRAAGLLSKSAGLAIVEKALDQAIAARRVFPPLAADFGEQIGYELPLKTKDFVRVVAHLLAASEKPIKGVVSKRKSEILAVLSELVGALTDTAPIVLPSWAIPKERAKKPEAESVDSTGVLERANAEALAVQAAEANASKAEANARVLNSEFSADILARAVNVILSHASELTEAQREMMLATLASTSEALI